jgi:hypothetical protein
MLILILFLALIVLYVWSASRFSELGSETRRLKQLLAEFERKLDILRKAQKTAEPAVPPQSAPAAAEKQPVVKEAVPAPVQPLREPIPEPKIAEAPKPSAIPAVKIPSGAIRDAIRDAEAAVSPPPRAASPAPTPSVSKPAPPPPSRQMPKFDWESLVGVKLFSWIAGIALLLAAVFFLRYSINQGWLTPPVQMAIGIIVGIGLLILCELRAARRYPVTANAMDASAIAILFSTFFAARALWNLIGAFSAFGLMVLVAAVAVLLSIRRNSIFIALLGLVGGFATPALLSTGVNSPKSLFSYLLLLNAGLAWVAAKKKWPLLTTLSLVFTVFYQWGWVMKFLTATQLPLALAIFLVFPVLAFVAFAFSRKEEEGKSWMALYGQTANLTAALPILFALYIAAIPAYGHQYGLLFGFLFLLDAGLFAIATARRQELLHLLGGISTLLIWAIWLGSSYGSFAWPGVLGFLVLFALFYLTAPFIARRFGHAFTGMGQKVVYTVPLLLFTIPCLAAMEPACAAPGLLFGTLILIMLAVSAYAIYSEEGFVFYIASAFALLAEAVWSIKYLTPERLYPALGIYAVFGLFYLGVPVAAYRFKKKLHPAAAGAALLLVSLALLFFLAVGPIAAVSIWGLAFLLLILNAGLFWQGAACKLPVLSILGMILSWIILGVLWASVSLAVILIPALVVMAGFALLVLAGNIWIEKKSAGAQASIAGEGIFLGLTGHVFLVAIATQHSLSVPPSSFLGVLFVLNLAVGAAALYTCRGNLHRAAMAASAILLMLWVSTSRVTPWPGVAILCAEALAAFSFIWVYLAKRKGVEVSSFSLTAAITVILAQFVVIVAASQSGSPSTVYLLAAHLVLLAALFVLLRIIGTYIFAVIAVIPTAIAIALWMFRHSAPAYWKELLLFAIPIYLAFNLYPFLLGRGVKRALAPYQAAVLASVPFFFQARHAMIQAGWGQAIGILPVAQALVLALVLMQLLRIEPPGVRHLGRLALVAGAALAFITAAIPLQLEKEWITIGWALEAAALAWLYGKIPHKGLLIAASGLFASVFIRLALNPSVLVYQPRGGIRIWNWYLYTYLVAAMAMISGGRLLAKTKDDLYDGLFRVSKVLPGGAVILIFLLLNIEIADFYSTGTRITFNLSAGLAQDLTYTLGWALFAVSLLITGIVLRNQAARIASLALLVITIFKCFLLDLTRLGGLYRVGSFVGLAICLALVALVLQKFVLSARVEEK